MLAVKVAECKFVFQGLICNGECLQCFDAVCLAAGRASDRGHLTEWWGAGVVICLEQG